MADAESDAQRAELVELARRLLDEVRAVRAEYAQLDAALGDIEQSAAWSRPHAGGGGDAARLVAVELVRAGHSRDDVESYLRRTFGIEADAALLDSVFTAEG
jgi:hypothetical protein